MQRIQEEGKTEQAGEVRRGPRMEGQGIFRMMALVWM